MVDLQWKSKITFCYRLFYLSPKLFNCFYRLWTPLTTLAKLL